MFVFIAVIGGVTLSFILTEMSLDQNSYADLPDQKGRNYKIHLEDSITFSDNIQVEQGIEGFKYQVKISDGIATKDILG